MKTLIVYGTKHGCTEKCADLLAKQFTGTVALRNLKTAKELDLAGYDQVVVGGSIYMGMIQKEVTAFCKKHLDVLLGKRLGLFICSMREGELAETELNAVFPRELVSHSVVKGYFGGEFIFSKMNFFEKMIVKKVSGISTDTSNIHEAHIKAFAQSLDNA